MIKQSLTENRKMEKFSAPGQSVTETPGMQLEVRVKYALSNHIACLSSKPYYSVFNLPTLFDTTLL